MSRELTQEELRELSDDVRALVKSWLEEIEEAADPQRACNLFMSAATTFLQYAEMQIQIQGGEITRPTVFKDPKEQN